MSEDIRSDKELINAVEMLYDVKVISVDKTDTAYIFKCEDGGADITVPLENI